MNRIVSLAAIALLAAAACKKGEQASQSSDSTARNLTLAPAESTQPMRDVPERRTNPPAPPQSSTRPRTTTHNAPPPPAPPARPAMMSLGVGTKIDVAANDTLSSRTSKTGDTFTAHVVEDVKNAQGQVVIPAGAAVSGKITAVKPAPNPKTPGTLTVAITSITVHGNSYPIDAAVDSIETVHKGRGVTGSDAAKVGAGAAAGAILGRVIGGNSKGTIIGGVVGGIAGAGYATQTKDSDIVLPKGAHIIIRLTKELSVSAD
ncbi:MAG TPA: glycine zipper domain-containing protein [Gemmatimonadales bacterium]|nr:glycine zipper domain-containing protein [Gemmatimonadales bacterium]